MHKTGLLRRLRGTLRIGAAASVAMSAVLVASPASPVSAATGDTWNVTGKAAGDQLGGSTINGYGITNGMGIFELTNAATGEVDYAFCIDSSVDHSVNGNVEHPSNVVNSSEVDYISWKYANASTSDEQAIAAQGLIWYYMGGMRNTGVPVWWDTTNNNAVTPFSPDPWNALPTFGWAAPDKPVGFQSVSPFNEDQVETTLYNMAVEVESYHGPWAISDTGTPGQIRLTGPGHPTHNPSGAIPGQTISWVDGAGNTVGTSVTDANGYASDPTGGSAYLATAASPGVHREANVNDLQMLGLRAESQMIQVQVSNPVSQPVLGTQISTNLAVANSTISDTVIISGMIGGHTATVRLQLFNLTHDPTGAGTPLVDVTTSGLGNGAHPGLAPYMVTFADAGDVLGYREMLVETTDGVSDPTWSNLGIASETTPVDISEPVVVTQISTDLALAGSTITDSVSIGGLVGGATADVQLQLFNLNDDPTGSGTPLIDVVVSGLSNGIHPGLAPYMVTFADAGDQLGYRERVISTTDGAPASSWSPLGVASETTPVDISEPTVVTNISDQEVFAGEVITDSITITGMVAGALADVQLQLFNLDHDPTGSGTPLVDITVENLSNGTFYGLGTYTVTLDDEGDRLGYRERVLSTSDGVSTGWSDLGIASETTDVLPQPQVVTNASVYVAAPGNTIHDTVTVADLAEHLGEMIDVEVSLYNISDDPLCESPLTSETVTLAVNGTHTDIAPYTVLTSQRGDTLGYVEMIVDSSDELRIPDEEWTPSTCGELSESIMIPEKAHLETVASVNSDTLIIENLYPEHTTEMTHFDEDNNPVVSQIVIPAETVAAVATLHGPFTDITSAGFMCDDESIVESVTLTGLGEGEHVVDFSTPEAYGVYTFQVSIYSEDLDGRYVSHGCGLASETFVFNPDLGIDTSTGGIVSAPNGAVEVADIVSVSDTGIDLHGDDASWNGSVTLYGPYESLEAATCEAEHALHSEGMSGVGDVSDLSVGGFMVSMPGIYTFVAEVTRDVDGASASHPCGLVAESFVVLGGVDVVTSAADDSVELGEMTHDTVTIANMGHDLAGAPMAWNASTSVYGPFSSLENAVCDAGSLVDTVHFSGLGEGTFDSPEISVDAPGLYTYITSVTRIVDDHSASHPCGLAAESFQATHPVSVDTQTVNAVILIEGETISVTDSLTITGMSTDWDWTASVTLYGPFEALENAACSAEHAVGSVTFSGSGDGTFTSPAISISEGGVYTFVAEVTRDIDLESATHPCGLAQETVTVTVEQPELPATGVELGNRYAAALTLAVVGLVLASAARRREENES